VDLTVKIRAVGRLPTGDLRATVTGVRRCGSAWRCPACAKARQAKDAEILHACNLGFRADHGAGDVYMVTLTAPHRAGQQLEALRRTVTRAYQRAHNGEPVQRWRKRYGIRATVRRLEVTVGPAGWHPHVHAMLFCDRTLSQQELASLKEWYFVRWGDAVTRLGWERPRKSALDITRADVQGRYLAKMGLLELAGDSSKFARCAACGEHVRSEWRGDRRVCVTCGREVNRTPWQILRDFHAHGAQRDRALWRTYYREIAGARRLTWSRWRGGCRLRDVYALEQRELGRLEEHPDLAIDWQAWAALSPRRKADVLDAYEQSDRHALEALLGDAMPAWHTRREPAYDPADPPADRRWLEDRLAGRATLEERSELSQVTDTPPTRRGRRSRRDTADA
jgi:hypothetical protein